MRKIISILIALGLVLAFSAVAKPAIAVTCTATVTVTPPPAGTGAVYCIKFMAPVALLGGSDQLSVRFGAGTTFDAGFTAADITVNGNVTTSFVSASTQIWFPIPAGVGTILQGALVTVCISDVINPAVPGAYTLELNYKLPATAPVVFGCGTYTITIGPETWYVVAGGAGAQNGANWGNAFATIQQAIDAAGPGDTITVAAGTYAAFKATGKTNIHIVGSEGAVVATTNLYTALPVIGNAWVLAAVYNSTDINIEGINFDGAGVTGKPVVVGIAYVDSTGRIADLTVENVRATELGAGVAVIGHASTSAVQMTRTTISNTDNAGIYVCGGSTLEAHFNKIADNAEVGLLNDGGGMVDGTYNWWGDASGPWHTTNILGRGDRIIGDVTFKPWLGGEIVTKTVTDSVGTVDALVEADTEVVVHGTATVTIARYASNPHPESIVTYLRYLATDSSNVSELNIFTDVYVTNFTSATWVEIRLYYTKAEAREFNETTLRPFWWNNTTATWEPCSPPAASNVNTTDITIKNITYSGYMWANVTKDTSPALTDLNGTPWGGYGHPTVKNDCCIASVAATSRTNVVQKLNILREFRDAVLLPDSSGAKFVSLYYRTSPPVAKLMSQYELLRTAVRVCLLEPIVAILGWSHDLWSAESLMSLAAIPVTK